MTGSQKFVANIEIENNCKIPFCNTLRGMAALIVLLAHYTHGFSALHGFLFNPSVIAPYPAGFIEFFYIDGSLGVALFFLVSGFVIPISLNNRNPLRFLQARCIRLYPTFIVCTLITVVVVVSFGIESITTALERALVSVTFFRDWLGGIPIDSIVWTLEVEAKFYLYMALMSRLMASKPLIVSLLPALTTITYYAISGTVFFSLGYITFITLGTLFYLLYIKRIAICHFSLCMITILLSASVFLWARYNGNTFVILNYICAALIFTFFYCFAQGFQSKISDFFADVSYPLYAIHAPFGYAFLSLLVYKMYFPVFSALVIVSASVVFLAYVIHIFVEAPTVKLSRRIS